MSKRKSEKIKRALSERAKKKRSRKEEKKKFMKEMLDDVGNIAQIVKTIIAKFFRSARVKIARFNITVATGDAATTAIAYGAVCQAVSLIVALLDNAKNVKGLSPAHINIRTDFTAEAPSADIKISFSLRVWDMLSINMAAIMGFAKNKLTNNESNKNSKINLNI